MSIHRRTHWIWKSLFTSKHILSGRVYSQMYTFYFEVFVHKKTHSIWGICLFPKSTFYMEVLFTNEYICLEVSIHRCTHSISRCLFTCELILTEERGKRILSLSVYSQMNTFYLDVSIHMWTHSIWRCVFAWDYIHSGNTLRITGSVCITISGIRSGVAVIAKNKIIQCLM